MILIIQMVKLKHREGKYNLPKLTRLISGKAGIWNQNVHLAFVFFTVTFDDPCWREEVSCTVTRLLGGTIAGSEFGHLDGHSLCPHSWSHVFFLGVSLASLFNMRLQQTLKGKTKFIFLSVSQFRDLYISIWEHEKLCQPLSSYTFLYIERNWKGLNRSEEEKFFVNFSFLLKCSCA